MTVAPATPRMIDRRDLLDVLDRVAARKVAAQARLGMPGEARARLSALADERASSGEIRNARAVICLAEGDPAGALGAVQAVLDGTAPVIGNVTVVEADLLAGLAHRELGDLRATNEAAERALALAESDRWPHALDPAGSPVNHRDQVRQPHQAAGKPGSGPPPGGRFQQRIDRGERAWSAATQPKGAPS